MPDPRSLLFQIIEKQLVLPDYLKTDLKEKISLLSESKNGQNLLQDMDRKYQKNVEKNLLQEIASYAKADPDLKQLTLAANMAKKRIIKKVEEKGNETINH